MDSKVMTLRLSAEQAEALEKVAEVEGMSVSEAIRAAIGNHIETCATNEEFRTRLDASMERTRAIFDRFSIS
jgi:hypothetical protein